MRAGTLVDRCAVAALFLLCCTPVAAQESTRQREALTPKAANRTVQRDLLSVFGPVERIRSGMFRQLRGVGLTTRAYGTQFEGLCRRDVVILSYAATDAAADPSDAPLSPYGVTAQPEFHLTRPPVAPPIGGRDPEVWQAACVSAGQETRWFAAKDAHAAFQGVLLLEAAVAAIRSGALKPEPCPYMADTKTTCSAAILAAGSIAHIDSVEACPSEPGTICYAIDFASSARLTIKGRAADDTLMPSEVIAISVEDYIIVT